MIDKSKVKGVKNIPTPEEIKKNMLEVAEKLKFFKFKDVNKKNNK